MTCDLKRPGSYGVNSGAIRTKIPWAKVQFPNLRLHSCPRMFTWVLVSEKAVRKRCSSAWEGGTMVGEHHGLITGSPPPHPNVYIFANILLFFVLENLASILYEISRIFSMLKFSRSIHSACLKQLRGTKRILQRSQSIFEGLCVNEFFIYTFITVP